MRIGSRAAMMAGLIGASLLQAAQAGWGAIPRGGKHRVSADSRSGRAMVSRKYRSSSLYVELRNSGGGARECERRVQQMAAGKLVFHDEFAKLKRETLRRTGGVAVEYKAAA
jgi:hypothetical protein